MTPEERKQVVRALYDAFNAKDIDRLDGMVLHGAGVELTGFETRLGIREAFQNWATAFPDAKVEIVRLEEKDGEVVAELIARGTHRRRLWIPGREVRPTHRHVELKLRETYVFDEAEEMISSGTSEFDASALYAQLGIEPPLKIPRDLTPTEEHWGY